MKTPTKHKKLSAKQKRMPIVKDKDALQKIIAEPNAFQNLFEKCLVKKD
jgi:hypothetical protein